MNQRLSSFDTILNLSMYHREHEKFYAQAPLRQALDIQQAANVLKTFADRWARVEPATPQPGNPFRGCDDLNEPADIQHTGVLFMEEEHEPSELTRLKRALHVIAEGCVETGAWLAKAMESAWESARPLAEIPPLAGVLGERHRIIANDWQAAYQSMLVGRLIERGLNILERVDFSPDAVRRDLGGPRFIVPYLYSAAELFDRAASIAAESAMLIHDNERRWRVFRDRVEQLTGVTERTLDGRDQLRDGTSETGEHDQRRSVTEPEAARAST